MGVSAVGRNQPCPCGSGKKYKKCCARRDEAAEAAASPRKMAFGLPPHGVVIDDLDQVSNAAVDAINAKRFEEAEQLCGRLLKEYPEVPDGHDRLGMLREAQGRFAEAADAYAAALKIMKAQPDCFDPQLVELFEQRRQEAAAKTEA